MSDRPAAPPGYVWSDAPVCDACDQPITDPEPCEQHIDGHTVFFHPDCCPECQPEQETP